MNIRYGKIVIRYSLQWLFGDEDKIEVPSCVLMFAAARQVIEGSRLLHRCVSVSLAKRAGNWEGKTRSHTAWNMSCWLSDWVLSWAVKNKQDIRTIWMQFLCVPCAEKKHAWRWLLLTQHKFPLSLLTTSFWISDVMCWILCNFNMEEDKRATLLFYLRNAVLVGTTLLSCDILLGESDQYPRQRFAGVWLASQTFVVFP